MECGNPEEQKDLKDFVLEKISKGERNILDEAVNNAANAVEEIIESGIDAAMNKYN